MRKIILLVFILLFPSLTFASTAGDFIVNSQPIYAAPPGTNELLILDLTLPSDKLTSIKIFNAGTAQQINISRLSIYQDGSSAGWDGDETEVVRKSSTPFFDTAIEGIF